MKVRQACWQERVQQERERGKSTVEAVRIQPVCMCVVCTYIHTYIPIQICVEFRTKITKYGAEVIAQQLRTLVFQTTGI